MLVGGPQALSDHCGLSDLREVAAQRVACVRRQFHEHAPTLVRIRGYERVLGLAVEGSTSARARSLAEAAETLEQAEDSLNRLKLGGSNSSASAEATVRIEAPKLQVESLRTRPRTKIDLK